MKFLIQKASNKIDFEINLPTKDAFVVRKPNEETCEWALYGIEINSLEELIDIKRECGDDLVIEDNQFDVDFPEYKYILTIYDSYIE